MRSRLQRVLPATLLLAAFGAVADTGAQEPDPEERLVSGTLEVVIEDDFHGGRANLIHYLRETPSGKLYRLRLGDPQGPRVAGGTRILVRGVVRGDELTAETGSFETMPADEPRAAAAVVEERRALVMIVDFADAAVPCPDSMIKDTMFSGALSVDGLYQETSFGGMSFPHDTDGDGAPDVIRLTIGATTTDACDKYGWAAAADAEAQTAGVDLDLYQHRVYVLPNWASCSWAGSANIGCAGFCRSWIRLCAWPDVFAHELGHNLGMRHASTDDDDDGTIDCSYCDISDFMGYGGQGWRQVNGPHKYQNGWLPAEQVVDVDPGSPQTLVLSPLESDPLSTAYPQLLRIPISTGDYYYLSYRVGVGYDQSMDPAYADRTSIHRSTATGSGNSALVATLEDGGVFEGRDGLSVTQVSHDASSVTLIVEAACEPVVSQHPDGYIGASTCQRWQRVAKPGPRSRKQQIGR